MEKFGLTGVQCMLVTFLARKAAWSGHVIIFPPGCSHFCQTFPRQLSFLVSFLEQFFSVPGSLIQEDTARDNDSSQSAERRHFVAEHQDGEPDENGAFEGV